MEDLKVPGAAGVADLSRDEVEDVARGRLARKRREQPGALDRRRNPGRVDDVEDDVPFASCCAACGDEVTLAVASYSMIWLS